MPRDQLYWIADTKADKTTADVFVTQVRLTTALPKQHDREENPTADFPFLHGA